MRIDQLISHVSALSRKEVKLAVRNKRVTVNGLVCTNSATKISSDDSVVFNNEVVAWPKDYYFMLNKPAGYCCSHNDDGHPSALRLLPITTAKLHFAGRLDADTTGLVLVSTDGQWCHRVTSPKQQSIKCKQKYYNVELITPLDTEHIKTLEKGIMLHGEDKLTLPSHITPVSNTSYNIAITEGRYHQVKRMFAAVNNRVQSLHRYQIADIILDHDLAMGAYRSLTQDEIDQFKGMS